MIPDLQVERWPDRKRKVLSILRAGRDAVVVLGYETETTAQTAVNGMIALLARNGKLTIEVTCDQRNRTDGGSQVGDGGGASRD
jgi:hypothetical protein